MSNVPIDSRVLADIQTKYGKFSFVSDDKNGAVAGSSRTIDYMLRYKNQNISVYADEIENDPGQWEVSVDLDDGVYWEIHNIDGLSLGALTAAIESSMEHMIASGVL